MSVDEVIAKFRKEYKEAYKGILPDEILDKGNEWLEDFLRQALESQLWDKCGECKDKDGLYVCHTCNGTGRVFKVGVEEIKGVIVQKELIPRVCKDSGQAEWSEGEARKLATAVQELIENKLMGGELI